MALPLINIYAYTMGGIGPVETKDISALSKLSEKNGVPFYAGRFYPKNHDAQWQLFNIGFNSQTAPWMTWEDIGPTQIWMLPAFEDERIIKLKLNPDRADVIEPALEIYTNALKFSNSNKFMVPRIGLADALIMSLIKDFDKVNNLDC